MSASTNNAKVPGARSRGRPRDPKTDRAILEATLRLMTQRGYQGTSLEAIAAEAGVGKPTIYLRYKSKESLLTAALALLHIEDAPEHTSDLRADLIAQLRDLRRWVERVSGMAMIGTLLAEQAERPELLAEFRRAIVRPRRALIRSVLERAIERGELPEGAAIDNAVDLLVGSYYAHYLAGRTFARNWPADEVDVVLDGLRARPAASRSGSRRPSPARS